MQKEKFLRSSFFNRSPPKLVFYTLNWKDTSVFRLNNAAGHSTWFSDLSPKLPEIELIMNTSLNRGLMRRSGFIRTHKMAKNHQDCFLLPSSRVSRLLRCCNW
jgi:hypothetical protein